MSDDSSNSGGIFGDFATGVEMTYDALTGKDPFKPLNNLGLGQPQNTRVKFDQNQLDSFFTSTDAKDLTSEEKILLMDSTYKDASGKFVDTKNNDISSLVNRFNTYTSQTQDTVNQRQKYIDLQNQTPGRDATILTGPEATYLGGRLK